MGSIKLKLLAALLLLFVKSTESQEQTQLQEPKCTQHLEVIAVVDGSETIADGEFVKLKTALIHLADGLGLRQGGQRFGAVVYSAVVSDTAPLNGDYDALKTQISAFRHPKQGTSTHLGIQKMTTMMEENGRPGVPKVGIVITDGQSYNRTATEIAAEQAKNINITMFAIGVGRYINTSELYSIGSRDENVLELPNFDELLASVTSLVKKVCIVHGGWSEWSVVNTTPCTVTCGEGSTTHISRRTCTNPTPSNGGNNCEGPETKTDTETCKKDDCPVDGGWSEWSMASISECSESCGRGHRTYTQNRTCTKPSPAHGGKDCEGLSTTDYTEACNEVECPVNGGWSEWSSVTKTECSASCGGGSRTCSQNRSCTEPAPAHGGLNCEGPNTQNYTEACNVETCPGSTNLCDECEYTNGVGYNPHPTDCNKFVQCIENGNYYVRNCAPGLKWNQDDLTCTFPSLSTCQSGATTTVSFDTTTEPVSLPCDGKKKEVTDNNKVYLEKVLGHGWTTRHCAAGTIFDITFCDCRFEPVNGGWSEWFVLSKTECSASCGGGSRSCTKTRTCSKPVPAHGGKGCTGLDIKDYTENCNTEECPDGEPTCRRYEVEGNKTVYLEFVAGFGNISRPCASGTVFDPAVCDCVRAAVVTVPVDEATTPVKEVSTPVNEVTTPVSTGCRPEVYLPFDTDFKDYSGNNLHIQNEFVTLESEGYASFKENSGLRIPRFSNMDFKKTLVISFLLHPGQTTDRDQAIVSNADCERDGSIYIIQKSEEIEFRVRNKTGALSSLSVSCGVSLYGDRLNRSRPQILVRLIVSDGIMEAHVGDQTSSTEFHGDIAKSHCALQIGRGTDYDNFIGNLDDFKVSICLPDSEDLSDNGELDVSDDLELDLSDDGDTRDFDTQFNLPIN